MGVDIGFDLVPPLSSDEQDRRGWAYFLEEIKWEFRNDTFACQTRCGILFKTGEHPILPFEGHHFLRFSSLIYPTTGRETARDCVLLVKTIAMKHFGSRITPYDDKTANWAYYSKVEVKRSLRRMKFQRDEFLSNFSNLSSPVSTVCQDPFEGTLCNSEAEESLRPLFRVEKIPDKGRGLVAAQDIAAGTRILAEAPLFTLQDNPDGTRISDFETHRAIASVLENMSEEQQRQFLSLHNSRGWKCRRLTGIFWTNALPCGGDPPIYGLFPTGSLANSSCVPNCHFNWNEDLRRKTLHAIAAIKEGEELTVDYGHGSLPVETRQQIYHDTWGFTCTCDACSLPPPEAEASDSRRMVWRVLRGAIRSDKRQRKCPQGVLADGRCLFEVFREEFGRTGDVTAEMLFFNELFRTCIAHGDRARAAVFADRAYRATVVFEGDDSPDTKRLKSLREMPEQHIVYRLGGNGWDSDVMDVPEFLGEDEFEKWLFREVEEWWN